MDSNLLRFSVLPLSTGSKNLTTTTTKSTILTNKGFGKSISIRCSAAPPDDLETTDASMAVTIRAGGETEKKVILENLEMRWPLWAEVVQAGKPVAKETVSIGNGRFGRFGGKYVPETLVACLSKLEAEFQCILQDAEFQAELNKALRDYVGRETPLYFAKRLTDHYKNSNGEGPEIYIKREDLNHVGSHKINNAIAQAMLAKRMGCKRVVAATGAGQHGVATAAACAKLDLGCQIIMGSVDIQKQTDNVLQMKLLGAQVISVDGNFKDATSQAIREWVGDIEASYYLPGIVVGPHPCPVMVREFQSVIGKETRRQAMEKWGGKPDVVIACVGSGSNALGIFSEFIDDEGVRLMGVEAGGFGLESGRHSATLARGTIGVYHGSMSYLLQDDEGQIVLPHSIGVGLEYPGVGPELSFLKDSGRAEFFTTTDEEAIDAYQRLCRLEGIIPALEAAHALAYLEKLCPTLSDGTKVVVCCSGRGDKDAATVIERLAAKDLHNYTPQAIN